jgi:hypothetical protein
MTLEEQLNESSLQSTFPQQDDHGPSSREDTTNRSDYQGDKDGKVDGDENGTYFIAKVWLFILLLEMCYFNPPPFFSSTCSISRWLFIRLLGSFSTLGYTFI